MKNKIIHIVLLITLMFQGCERKEIADLNVDLNAEKTTYEVGEEVLFSIAGNPEQLTFFSGEEGHKYAYRNRTVAESKAITLEFATNRRYGSDALHPNSLRLFASQRFAGNYTPEGIMEQEWTEVTAAFTLSGSQNDNDTYVSSGEVDLNTLANLGLVIDPDKPLYFAFKYTGNTGSTQPRWWINKFDINTITTDEQILPITSLQDAGWVSIGLHDSPVSWILSTDGLRFQGGSETILSNTVYAVSKGLNINAITPDVGVALKNMSTRLDKYAHVYTTPGTYEVVFVAANTNIYGSNTVVKTMTLEITEKAPNPNEETLYFDVNTDRTTYRAGEPIIFQIGGNSSEFEFFSGETGHRYAYREPVSSVPTAVTLEFSTIARWGNLASHPNSFRLLASQGFSGTYAANAIIESEWIDISNHFTIPTTLASNWDNYTPSGLVDLTTLTSLGLDLTKPIYFAFKYTAQEHASHSKPTWRVNRFDLRAHYADNSSVAIGSLQSATFGGTSSNSIAPGTIVLEGTPTNAFYDALNGFYGVTGGAATTPRVVVWAVSQPFGLGSVIGPESGVVVATADTYSHTYTTPGTYEVTFVGSNTGLAGEETIVRTLTFAITAN